MTELITNWLADFSQDFLSAGEGWAVFPLGEKLLSRREDILGGEAVRKQLRFRIVLHSRTPAAKALEEFGLWAEKTAPTLGERQTVRLEDAHLAAKGKEAMGRYEAKLIFEFTI